MYKEALLVSSVVSRFVEPVRLFPASVKAHGSLVLQQVVNTTSSAGWPASKTLLLGVTNWRHRQSEEDTAEGSSAVKKKRVCPMNVRLSYIHLTHIVEAIGFASFGTHEWYICPFAVAVRVAFNQVIGRLSVPNPVTQELTDTASMDDSITEHIQIGRYL